MQKAKRNLEYMQSLNRSIEQFEEGKTVPKTMDELLAMETEEQIEVKKCKCHYEE